MHARPRRPTPVPGRNARRHPVRRVQRAQLQAWFSARGPQCERGQAEQARVVRRSLDRAEDPCGSARVVREFDEHPTNFQSDPKGEFGAIPRSDCEAIPRRLQGVNEASTGWGASVRLPGLDEASPKHLYCRRPDGCTVQRTASTSPQECAVTASIRLPDSTSQAVRWRPMRRVMLLQPPAPGIRPNRSSGNWK